MNRGGQFLRSAGSRQAPRSPYDFTPPSRVALFLRRALVRLSKRPLRHIGIFLLAALFAATGGYGAARGGHAEALFVALHDAGNTAARAFGFGIVQTDIRGRRLDRDDLLRRAGITEQSSLLLLDTEGVREVLKRDPRIAEVTVRKFYPDRLEVVIEEREAFARWQRAGRLLLIARDGTVLESDVGSKRAELPLVVGIGAETRAAALLELVAAFPSIHEEMRAGVLVAERRWNIRLKNGIDVRLPEEDPALALKHLVALDGSRKLLSRDLTMIDLRVPDRVTVGLTDEAAAAREQKSAKPRGAES